MYVGLVDGSHSLKVRSIDNAGGTDPTPATVSWTILTSTEAIEQLGAAIIALQLPAGIETGMLKQLDGADKRLNDDNSSNDGAAIGKLQEFINKVEDQREVRITSIDADRLITAADNIIAEILADLGSDILDDDLLALFVG